MFRTFHPVGQGAFYSEIFDNDFTVVYDCGTRSSNSMAILRREIENIIINRKHINAVFISHFDFDHINGLELLLNSCSVDKIFLPLINDNEKILLLTKNKIQGITSEFFTNLIVHPERLADGNETDVIFVSPIEGVFKEEPKFVNIHELPNNSTIPSGSILKSVDIEGWIYIPFNFRSSDRAVALQQKLIQHNIDINSNNDFIRYWDDKNSRNFIISAYNSLPGKINVNSMTLYSGPILGQNPPPMLPYYPINHSRSIHLYKPGCLYLGDYNLNVKDTWSSLFLNYKAHWENIGTVQIPHHGSRRNYNVKINQKPSLISVISAGKNYKHPDKSTIFNIRLHRGIPIVVTEELDKKRVFYIFFSIK